jgi:outer membrane protein assembly factor BamB
MIRKEPVPGGDSRLPGVFISYRRELDAGWAPWLYDKLSDRFGGDRIFMDLDSIAAGDDFVEVITHSVASCRVLIALIGKGWSQALDAGGRRRLDDPGDFVRIEIESALRHGIRVIPLLIEGAKMPPAGELPDTLAPIAQRQALTLTGTHRRYDAENLIEAVNRALDQPPAEPLPVPPPPPTPEVPAQGQLDRPLVVDAHQEHNVALGAALTAPPTTVVKPKPATVDTDPPTPVVRGRAKVTPTAAPITAGTGGGTVGTGVKQIGGALTTRRGWIAAAIAAVLVAATVAATLWLRPLSTGHPQTSTPAGPVQLFAAPVQGPIETAVAVDTDRLYFATGKTIRAVSRADGSPAWRLPFTVPARIVSGPYLSGDTLYASGRDNRLYAINTADGSKRWSLSTGNRYPGPPKVVGEALYFGTSGGMFYKLWLTHRKRLWRYQTHKAVQHAPAVGAGLVAVNSSDGTLYLFDADDGDSRRWTLPIEPSSTPVIADHQVFVGSADKKIYAISTLTHKTNWTFPTGAAVISTPAFGNGLVYIGGQDGTVYAIDAATGQQRWSLPGIAGEKFGSPEVTGGVVYVATDAGRVYALDAATGRPLWKHAVNGRPGPLRVVDGVLYVGTTAKILYAFRVAESPPPGPVVTSAPSGLTESTTTPSPQRTRRPLPNEPEPTKDWTGTTTTQPPTTTPPTTDPTPWPTLNETGAG